MDEIPVRREHSLTLKLHEAKGLQSDLTRKFLLLNLFCYYALFIYLFEKCE